LIETKLLRPFCPASIERWNSALADILPKLGARQRQSFEDGHDDDKGIVPFKRQRYHESKYQPEIEIS